MLRAKLTRVQVGLFLIGVVMVVTSCLTVATLYTFSAARPVDFISYLTLANSATVAGVCLMAGVAYDYLRSTKPLYHKVKETEARLEASLKSLAQKQAALDEHSIISMTDVSGRITYVNKNFVALSGFAEHELLGSTFDVVRSGEHSPEYYAAIVESMARGRPWRGEIKNLTKSGSAFWVNTSIIPFRDDDGSLGGFIVVQSDITKIKSAEEKLWRSEKYFRAVFQFSNDAIFLLDPATRRVVKVNSQALAMSGMDETELVGADPGAIFSGLDPFWIGQDRGDGKSRHYATGELASATGRRVPIEISVSEIMVLDRRLTVVHARDISDRLQFEQAIERARLEAERANRTKSMFVANMSHEIRTPLTAILGFTEYLMSRGNLPTHAEAMMERVYANGKHLLSIVNDVLDLSRIEAGQIDTHVVAHSLPNLLNDVLTVVKPSHFTNVAFRVTGCSSVPAVIHTDPIRLKQILVNLLDNAFKFTREGKVELSLHFRSGEGVSGSGHRLEFYFVDSGCGIAADRAEALFQPFVQADDSLTREVGGMGLGLAIARRLATLLGGGVELVETVVGRGSTFKVAIDPGDVDLATLIETDEIEAALGIRRHQTHVGADQLAGRRVLIVEDGRDNRILYSSVVQAAGAVALEAEDGAEGVARAVAEDCDVILMDIQMPVMDGYEAVRELRRLGFPKPIIALTAHAMTGERERCLKAGFDDYLSKPVPIEKLIATLRAWGERRQGAAQVCEAQSFSVSLVSDAPPEVSLYENDQIIGPLIAMFALELPKRIDECRAALASEDRVRLAKAAHQLKGSSGSFGFPRLAELAAGVEQRSKNADSTLPLDLSGQLAELNMLADKIALRFRGQAPAAPQWVSQ